MVCGTIACGDDCDDIVDWGETHLSFLRLFCEFHHGIPCADWLRTVMNRIDPELFAACFSSWVAECWPDKPDLVAIDGKTSRRNKLVATAPGTLDRAVVRKIILGALVTGAMVTFAAG